MSALGNCCLVGLDCISWLGVHLMDSECDMASFLWIVNVTPCLSFGQWMWHGVCLMDSECDTVSVLWTVNVTFTCDGMTCVSPWYDLRDWLGVKYQEYKTCPPPPPLHHHHNCPHPLPSCITNKTPLTQVVQFIMQPNKRIPISIFLWDYRATGNLPSLFPFKFFFTHISGPRKHTWLVFFSRQKTVMSVIQLK